MGMIVKVGGALVALGAQAEFRFRTTAQAMDAMPENAVFEGEISVSGTCSNTGRTYRLEGVVQVVRSFVCDRCLGIFSLPQEYPFVEDFLREETAGEDEAADGVSRFSGEGIDIMPLVRDTIFTAQPIRNLCRVDCRGLCPRCGADLNQEDCGCDRRSIDPRLAVLQDLLLTDD